MLHSSFLRRVIIQTVQTGSTTSIVSIIILITYLIKNDSNGDFHNLPKVYPSLTSRSAYGMHLPHRPPLCFDSPFQLEPPPASTPRSRDEFDPHV
jgi:hypothetical protein